MKAGIIGYGYWGPKLARNFAAAGITLSYVADHNRQNLEEASKAHPLSRLITSEEIIFHDPEIAAVIISTQADRHFALAGKALKAGKHVLIEKPFTLSSEEASELKRLSEEKGLTLLIDHTYLYSPGIREIKKQLETGALGKPLYFQSTRANLGHYKTHVNVVWDLMPHDFAVLLYLFEEKPSAISCHGICENRDTQSIANITLKYPSGMIAQVHGSWSSPMKVREVQVVGEKKTAVFDDCLTDHKLRIFEKKTNVPRPSSADINVTVPEISQEEPLNILVSDFLNSVQNNQPPVSNASLGLEVVKLLEAANRSMNQEGESVKITWK